jgi:hypothetical protein
MEPRSLRTVLTEYSMPTGNRQPEQVRDGPDNAHCCTESNANKIGRVAISGSTHSFTEDAVPASGSYPDGNARRLDGNLGFAFDDSFLDAGGQITRGGPPAHGPMGPGSSCERLSKFSSGL